MSLGKTLQHPDQVLVKPRKDTNNVSCHGDITEILLKATGNTIQPTNHQKAGQNPAHQLLPHNKMLDCFYLKASVCSSKIQVVRIIGFVFERVENILRKRENAGYQHFLLYPQRFL